MGLSAINFHHFVVEKINGCLNGFHIFNNLGYCNELDLRSLKKNLWLN